MTGLLLSGATPGELELDRRHIHQQQSLKEAGEHGGPVLPPLG